jgi:hypothetical protein
MLAKRMRRNAVLLAALFVVAGAGVSCSGSGDSDAQGGSTAAVPAAAEADRGGAGGGGGGSIGTHARGAAQDAASSYDALGDGGEDGGAPMPDAFLVGASDRVIKTANLRLEVEDGELARTLREGRAIAEGAGGFLLSTSIHGADRRTGEFTIRVPAERFEETLSALEDLGELAGEDVRGEDVSQEFVDLEARLRNATAQEEVLFRLYDRSNTIADTIRVQRELEDVQLEIERLRGRLRYLEDRTDLSTITVLVAESGAVVAEAGPFEKAWRNAKDTFVAVVSAAIVGAGFLLPFLAFALLAYGIFRIVRPRLQRATP